MTNTVPTYYPPPAPNTTAKPLVAKVFVPPVAPATSVAITASPVLATGVTQMQTFSPEVQQLPALVIDYEQKTIDHIIADVSKVQIEVSSNDQLSASTEDASEMPTEKSFVSSVNEITNNAALILNDTLDYQAQPSSNTIVDTDIIKHTESGNFFY